MATSRPSTCPGRKQPNLQRVTWYCSDAKGVTHGFVATAGTGANLATLAEMAQLPAVVSQPTGASTGQAYFDPSQPVNVVAVGSPNQIWRSLWGRGSVIDRRVSRPRELSKPKAIPGVPIIWEFREVH
jgi:hypothetical protein